MLTLRYYIVKMSLLIHTCCADCLLHLINNLGVRDEVVIYFDNPNIHPRSEMLSRLAAVKKVGLELGVKKVVVADWKPGEYFRAIEENKTKGVRCTRCWELRLQKLSKKAKSMGIGRATTTMLASSYLNREKIIELGENIAKAQGVELIVPRKCTKKCCHKGFYKQNYCGCAYSLIERLEEKYLTPECHPD